MEKVDFPALKAALTIDKMIKFLDLKGKWEQSGDFRCACPRCKPEGDRQLALGKSKKGEDAFTCWISSPRAQGDLIYLVAHVKDIKQIDAARLLRDTFLREPEKPKRKSRAKVQRKAVEVQPATNSGVGGTAPQKVDDYEYRDLL